MVVTSVERFFVPQPIHYVQAIPIAVVGLIVNVACALILGNAHHHGDGVDDLHHDEHGRHAHDLNLRSAYIHVVADAATSVLAITALTGGLFFGWAWLDPSMGIVGAAAVAVWAWGLVTQTSKVLLDSEMDHPVVKEIREALESPHDEDGPRVTDLHVWRVGKQSFAAALTLVTHDGTLTATRVRETLAVHKEIAHVTVEIQRCSAIRQG
jgi:cation diffusion facilitator family transporter